MVLEPSLLLADEPTGNLDRATGEAIHKLFLDLNRERGSTLLVVTHNPELARADAAPDAHDRRRSARRGAPGHAVARQRRRCRPPRPRRRRVRSGRGRADADRPDRPSPSRSGRIDPRRSIRIDSRSGPRRIASGADPIRSSSDRVRSARRRAETRDRRPLRIGVRRARRARRRRRSRRDRRLGPRRRPPSHSRAGPIAQATRGEATPLNLAGPRDRARPVPRQPQGRGRRDPRPAAVQARARCSTPRSCARTCARCGRWASSPTSTSRPRSRRAAA